MKKLRYSVGMKTFVLGAHQILAVILTLFVVILALLFQKNILNYDEKANTPFESSEYFADQFKNMSKEIFEFVRLRRNFETHGVYNPDKEVNIWKYYENQEISEDIGQKKRKNAITYRLGDLAEWSREYGISYVEFVSEYFLDNGIQQKQNIFRNGESVFSEEKEVKRLEDMTPQLRDKIVKNVEYYYGGSYSASIGAVKEETKESLVSAAKTEAQAEMEAEGENADSQKIIEKVLNGGLFELDDKELQWLMKDMGMESTIDSSTYEFVDEDYLPVEGTAIWDKFLKGECSQEYMQNAYQALRFTLENINEQLSCYRKGANRYSQDSERTNVRYWVSWDKGTKYCTNIKDFKGIDFPSYGKELGKYLLYRESDVHFETNVKGMEDFFYAQIEPQYGGKGSVLFVGLDTDFPYADNFQEAKREYGRLQPWIRISLWGAVASLILIVICLIFLSTASGKHDETEQIHLNYFDRIPTEILFFLAAAETILFFWGTGAVWRHRQDGVGTLLAMSGGLAFLGTSFFLAFYLSFVRRIRAGVLWSNSIASWFFHGIGLLFTSRKSLTKMVIWFGLHLLACLVILPMIAVSYESGLSLTGTALFALLCGVEAVVIIREGVQRNKVLEGIGKISGGDLEYKIAEEELRGDNKKLAHAVNAIGEGLYRAADESIKNERLQADLITNVSHDIKTPLTSIINYVDLLKREQLENERARGYIAVLDSKSQRLKQLAEDLVEASRISSGNIKLEMERINLVELVHQTEGEFAERFEARGLQVVSNLPRESVTILADGRRIWRVLENLYNNVAKYAMERTRVYVDMQAHEGTVLFSIKNISENPLNIEADELTERFIRGDISRSTEGSGLGLSIAKNLTLLMGGTFEIYLDGDLFKVMIGFGCL